LKEPVAGPEAGEAGSLGKAETLKAEILK